MVGVLEDSWRCVRSMLYLEGSIKIARVCLPFGRLLEGLGGEWTV